MGAGLHNWFLKLLLSVTLVCMCACVSTPKVINNHWSDVDRISLVKHVIQPLAMWYTFGINSR